MLIKLCLSLEVRVTFNVNFMLELAFYPLYFWRASDPMKQTINVMYYRLPVPIWRTSAFIAVGPTIDKCWADTFDIASLKHYL